MGTLSMKIILAILLLALLIAGCSQGPKKVKILAVEPQHATRAIVIYECEDGSVVRSSEHHSATIRLGGKVVNVGDYVHGRKPYGKVP